MSDGKEERKEQEERRKWEEERKNPRRDGDVREPDWERDGRPERRDSRGQCIVLRPRLDRYGSLMEEDLPAVVPKYPK
jgi:hypothetical protein